MNRLLDVVRRLVANWRATTITSTNQHSDGTELVRLGQGAHVRGYFGKVNEND